MSRTVWRVAPSRVLPGYVLVRPRLDGRWVGPPLWATSVASATALIPSGATALFSESVFAFERERSAAA
jgi:hypothetical protein